jgi:hypothetical protein
MSRRYSLNMETTAGARREPSAQARPDAQVLE